MDLTSEQIQRIEDNKARALNILRHKQEQLKQTSDLLCWNVEQCKSENIDQSLYETFDERICSVCKVKSNEYDLISKGEACSTYLVTDDAMTTLKFKTRNNPHHANWTPMKLYLRKHVIDLCLKRFGSLEKLAEVKQKRESQKYEKSLSKTVDIFTSSTEVLREQLHDNIGSSTGPASVELSETKRKRNGNVATESQKRKKGALSSLVGIIRGNVTK